MATHILGLQLERIYQALRVVLVGTTHAVTEHVLVQHAQLAIQLGVPHPQLCEIACLDIELLNQRLELLHALEQDLALGEGGRIALLPGLCLRVQ